MGAKTDIQLPVKDSTSPSGHPLELIMFLGKEGISTKSIVLEGVMTYREWADGFTAEANSDKIEEKYKSQRDVDEKRVNGLDNYFDTRFDTSLPGITIFVTDLEIIEEFENAGDYGYEVRCEVLKASDYGVPQARQRVIVIGIRKDLNLIPCCFFNNEV